MKRQYKQRLGFLISGGSLILFFFGVWRSEALSVPITYARDSASLVGAAECATTPAWVGQIEPPAEVGDAATVAFVTGQNEPVGLVLAYQNPTTGQLALIQPHPSWAEAGWLGAITRDGDGNLYAAPTPRDATTSVSATRTIWKLDATTGVFSPWVTLPEPAEADERNPFGILGLTLDCRTNSLYVSSVAGSGPQAERGRIVRVNLTTGIVTTVLDGFDAMGLTIAATTDELHLLIASARTPDLWALGLDRFGYAVGEPQPMLDLRSEAGLGSGLRARRLAITPDGGLQITAVPFAFTLETRGEREEEVVVVRVKDER